MEIQRSGSQPFGKGPADWFTGVVRIDSSFKGREPARVSGAIVIAIQEQLDGKAVDWMEKVSNEQFGK